MKAIILLIGILFPVLIQAQTKKQIIKKVVENNDRYRSHHTVYRSWMKYQSDEDTSFEVIDTKIQCIHKRPQMGTAQCISKDTVYYVYNLNEMVYLFSSNDCYYTMSKSQQGLEAMKENFNKFKYRPFRFTKKDLKTYSLTPDTNQHYFVMEYKSTVMDKMDTIAFRTLLYIRKSDYMPSRYYNWAYFGGGVQYKRMELDTAEQLKISVMRFSKEVDSLNRVYKSHHSGDSVNRLFTERFRKIKVGDTCRALIGSMHPFTDSLNLFQNGDSILILDFSYTSCGWCVYSIPTLKNLYTRYDSSGVGVYSIDPFKNDWPKLDKFIAFYKVTYPIVKVDYQYTFDYGIRAYPTLFIIKNGILIYMHVGYSEKMEEEIIREVELALKG